MQHICILVSNGNCGSGFFTGVMASNPYVVGNEEFGYLDPFEHKYVAAKFEDCKLFPAKMFPKICDALCILYQDSMLGAEARESRNIDGEDIKGFNLTSVRRKIDHVFSGFDKVRLETFYSQMNEHYGYDYFDFDEQAISDEEVEMWFDSKEELREALKTILMEGYQISRYGKIRFPYFIRKNY